jgi:hypothetical protein
MSRSEKMEKNEIEMDGLRMEAFLKEKQSCTTKWNVCGKETEISIVTDDGSNLDEVYEQMLATLKGVGFNVDEYETDKTEIKE